MKKTLTSITILALASSAILRLSARDEQPVVTPKAAIDLIEKSKFDTYPFHLNPEKSPTGKKGDVWEITANGLHVIGKGFGYFRTNTRYRDYHLVMEYKWGEKTWEPRLDRARDCGLLLHAHGPDGSLSNTWLASIEAQLIEGGSGDLLVLQGKREDGSLIETRLTCEAGKDRDGESIWKPGAPASAFPEGERQNQRINWRDRDPDWSDVIDFRGSKDIENAKGWNRLEVICDGDRIEVFLNGEHINGGRNAQPSEGYICLQGEAAQCFIRRLELHPIGGFTEKWPPAK